MREVTKITEEPDSWTSWITEYVGNGVLPATVNRSGVNLCVISLEIGGKSVSLYFQAEMDLMGPIIDEDSIQLVDADES